MSAMQQLLLAIDVEVGTPPPTPPSSAIVLKFAGAPYTPPSSFPIVLQFDSAAYTPPT